MNIVYNIDEYIEYGIEFANLVHKFGINIYDINPNSLIEFPDSTWSNNLDHQKGILRGCNTGESGILKLQFIELYNKFLKELIIIKEKNEYLKRKMEE